MTLVNQIPNNVLVLLWLQHVGFLLVLLFVLLNHQCTLVLQTFSFTFNQLFFLKNSGLSPPWPRPIFVYGSLAQSLVLRLGSPLALMALNQEEAETMNRTENNSIFSFKAAQYYHIRLSFCK